MTSRIGRAGYCCAYAGTATSAKANNPMQDLELGLVDLTAFMRLGEDHIELFRRMHLGVTFCRMEPEQAQEEVTNPIQQPDQRREDHSEEGHGASDP